ncbi:MAG: carbon-nitrogen hydrolase family protein [Spirochaetia bacterium]
MKTVIACGQFAPASGDIARNTERIDGFAAEAARRGAAVLVLPELCLCGYPSREESRGRAVAPNGPEMARLAECARSRGISLCFGFVELEPTGILHNSMAFIDRTGRLGGVYRKVHLWAAEKEWADPGEGFGCVDLGSLKLGMWICYDTRFPEAARTLARSGATLGLVGSAWFGPAEEWELALRARALDNGMFVAGAAVQGRFGEADFHGASLIVSPHGRVLAQAEEGRDELICAEYDSDAVAAFRARLPLLADLRPGAYA